MYTGVAMGNVDHRRILNVPSHGRAALYTVISRNVCIIADESKLKENGIGTFRVPVEVLPYLNQMTRNQVSS